MSGAYIGQLGASESVRVKSVELVAPQADGSNYYWISFERISNPADERWNPGDLFRDRIEGAPDIPTPEMVVLPSGSFTMGSPSSEPDRDDDEGPQRTVRIGYKLAVGKYEVTWAEWEACVSAGGCDGSGPEGSGGDNGWGRGNRPVIEVSWNDAQAYVKWLSRKTGHTYRLLSEAEWEYAARAGGDECLFVWKFNLHLPGQSR